MLVLSNVNIPLTSGLDIGIKAMRAINFCTKFDTFCFVSPFLYPTSLFAIDDDGGAEYRYVHERWQQQQQLSDLLLEC